MPFPTGSGAKSEVDQQLKSKRQQIIEEERVRILGDSFMSFYDMLIENYELLYPQVNNDNMENDDIPERKPVSRKEVEEHARSYAETKPIGY